MTTYHRRQLIINFSELPKFETDAEINAWHQSLGRMLAYGLHQQADQPQDTQSLVLGGIIDKGAELCCTYYGPTPERTETWEDGSLKYLGSPCQKLDDYLNSTPREHGFTMAAIKREDNRYSYHS